MFGIKGDVRDNIHYVDESTVLYPAGHQIILHHIETKTQRFIQGSAEVEGITCVALSANRKYLAVAERAEKAQITVYDMASLKRRKVLSASSVNSRVRPRPRPRTPSPLQIRALPLAAPRRRPSPHSSIFHLSPASKLDPSSQRSRRST